MAPISKTPHYSPGPPTWSFSLYQQGFFFVENPSAGNPAHNTPLYLFPVSSELPPVSPSQVPLMETFFPTPFRIILHFLKIYQSSVVTEWLRPTIEPFPNVSSMGFFSLGDLSGIVFLSILHVVSSILNFSKISPPVSFLSSGPFLTQRPGGNHIMPFITLFPCTFPPNTIGLPFPPPPSSIFY